MAADFLCNNSRELRCNPSSRAEIHSISHNFMTESENLPFPEQTARLARHDRFAKTSSPSQGVHARCPASIRLAYNSFRYWNARQDRACAEGARGYRHEQAWPAPDLCFRSHKRKEKQKSPATNTIDCSVDTRVHPCVDGPGLICGLRPPPAKPGACVSPLHFSIRLRGAFSPGHDLCASSISQIRPHNQSRKSKSKYFIDAKYITRISTKAPPQSY